MSCALGVEVKARPKEFQSKEHLIRQERYLSRRKYQVGGTCVRMRVQGLSCGHADGLMCGRVCRQTRSWSCGRVKLCVCVRVGACGVCGCMRPCMCMFMCKGALMRSCTHAFVPGLRRWCAHACLHWVVCPFLWSIVRVRAYVRACICVCVPGSSQLFQDFFERGTAKESRRGPALYPCQRPS